MIPLAMGTLACVPLGSSNVQCVLHMEFSLLNNFAHRNVDVYRVFIDVFDVIFDVSIFGLASLRSCRRSTTCNILIVPSMKALA